MTISARPSVPPHGVRNLVLVLGDQLAAPEDNSAFDGFDSKSDVVWMAEVAEEVEHVWAHKQRIAVFLAAMRHHRNDLRERGYTLNYTELPRDPAQDRGGSFGELLAQDIATLRPRGLVVCAPGDFRVRAQLQAVARASGVPLTITPDRHFFSTPEAFSAWVGTRKSLVLELFYREMRREHRVLVDTDEQPEGGRWNYDVENRASLPRGGPARVVPLPQFPPDAVTTEVLHMVKARFEAHPGSLDDFALPVTRAQAQAWLDDFIENRLALFGRYEDAMWLGQPVLYHSRLSLPLNLKLLGARACVEAAVRAYHAGRAPLAAVEGFVRQILGWREFVRGVYWHHMPSYRELNELGCEDRAVPRFYWNGETRMACVGDATRTLVATGYTHHIVRLMVLGDFALLLGVHPGRFHEWHMAMYLDAIDWVSLPNALGMSQYGDGGIVGTKPYAGAANYINRMSNYCRRCPYDPHRATGEGACPFNALYYDFLARHRQRFARNRRMRMPLQNLERKTSRELVQLRRHADVIRTQIDHNEGP